ncbi:MAG: hypothetical protein ACPGQL_01630 [Thermoplasmatota archaeon]
MSSLHVATMGAAMLVLLLVAPGAQAATEFEILDGYLAGHDLAPATPHCLRDSGVVYVPPPVDMEQVLPLATNSLLREHVLWHIEHEPHGGEQRLPGPEDQFGIVFFDYHRGLIEDYDTWRVAAGHEAVAPWDPGTAIPDDFA